MNPIGKALGALALAALCLSAEATSSAPTPAATQAAALPAGASADARYVLQWVKSSRDNEGRPFAVVDKKAAKLHVFDGGGRLVASTTVLLGAAIGDDISPGVGAKALKDLLPHELTTPAGRFMTEPGRNLDGEAVVWVDYDAGFAIHRVRPGSSRAGRVEKLATPSPRDNRTSYGCVVVPTDFYVSVVERVFGQRRGVVYVLPETQPVGAMFGPEGAAAAM